MEYQIIILIFASIFVCSSAILWEKPDVIEVTDENQEEFALPVGTKLQLDERTQLYKPPPLTKDFKAKHRMEVQWFNKKTRYNYCKVGPDISSWKTWFQFVLFTWCRDKDGEDMCCGRYKCSCDSVQANCACVTPKEFEYYEKKKQEDLDKDLEIANKEVDRLFATTTATPMEKRKAVVVGAEESPDETAATE